MTDRPPAAVLVAGLGNDLRGDDGVGLAVAGRLRREFDCDDVEVIALAAEPLELLHRLSGRRALVLVDAIGAGEAPGTVHRLDASARPLAVARLGFASTHALGLGQVLELARTLGTLPRRVVVFGIVGRDFSPGAPVSAPVSRALPDLARRVAAEARTHAHHGGSGSRPRQPGPAR